MRICRCRKAPAGALRCRGSDEYRGLIVRPDAKRRSAPRVSYSYWVRYVQKADHSRGQTHRPPRVSREQRSRGWKCSFGFPFRNGGQGSVRRKPSAARTLLDEGTRRAGAQPALWSTLTVREECRAPPAGGDADPTPP